MGLLPCLRRGSDRWWLPRSAVATEAIAQILLAGGRRSIDADTVRWIESAISTDPPLLIYAALGWPGDQASVKDLAEWLVDHIGNRVASGDAYLGAPLPDGATHQQWRKLRDHCHTIPLTRWLEDAAAWLEVTGPHVSIAWREQWPTLIGDASDPVAAPHSDDMLQQLARMMQRQRSLEQSFDTRLHKNKMGALKQLAYGLSHEINNPLANISTRAQQLQRGEEDPTRLAILQRIVEQVYRAHAMIADLMFFANPPAADCQPCDLNLVAREVAEDFGDECERQAIRMEIETPQDPTETAVDKNMVSEALRALIRNSVDAIGCQGTVVVSIVREAGQIMIHVADSGPGLSDHAREHAFDPYFSGREAGRGLGLGLCRAYRIAKLHEGEVTLAGGPTGCVATIRLTVA